MNIKSSFYIIIKTRSQVKLGCWTNDVLIMHKYTCPYSTATAHGLALLCLNLQTLPLNFSFLFSLKPTVCEMPVDNLEKTDPKPTCCTCCTC